LKAQDARDVARGDSLLEQAKALQKKAQDLLTKAELAGDLRTALQGVREAKGCLELMAKLHETAFLLARLDRLEQQMLGGQK